MEQRSGENGLHMMPSWRATAFFALLFLLLNYAWEMGQDQFFASFGNLPLWKRAALCLRSALGDLLIGVACYLVAAVIFWRADWPARPGWLFPAKIWLLAGIFITIAFELWALRSGRWSYSENMPTILGVGLLPLLQWIFVPTLTLAVMRTAIRQRSRWTS